MSHKQALNVTFLTPSLSRNAGGIFDAVRRNVIELHRQGVRAKVLAPTDPYATLDLPAWHPVDATPFPYIGPSKFGCSPQIRRQVAALNPDVIHQHGLWTYASLISMRRKKGVVISPHGMLDRWALGNSRTRKRIAGALFETANLQRADCLHALNSREAASIRDLGLKTPIAIIPNGADLPDPLDISTAKRPNWLPDDGRKTLLFLGRIHPKKGIAELLHAWTIFKAHAPTLAANWRVVIAGWDDGDHIATLTKFATNHDLAADILFPGPVYNADKKALLAHADAFILPSFSEGLPMSVLEAWSYALPVLMTDHCNLSFAFQSGAAIEIPNQPTKLASELATTLANPNLAQRGTQGHATVQRDFAWQTVSAMYKDLYAWVAGHAEAPKFVQFSDQKAP